jgi:hypothetical protein
MKLPFRPKTFRTKFFILEFQQSSIKE